MSIRLVASQLLLMILLGNRVTLFLINNLLIYKIKAQEMIFKKMEQKKK